jgi:CDP-glycerol glycerophosphotransferase
MQRDYALVDQAALEGRDGTLTCSIRLARPLEQGGVLRWRTLDGELVDGLMEVDPGDPLRVTARVRLDVQSSSGDHTERIWRGAIEYGAADEPAASTSLVTTTDAELVSASNDTGLRELAVGIGGGGRLTVTDRPARVEVIGAQWRRGNLVVTLRLPPRCVAAETKVALLRRSGGNVADPTIVDVRGEELTVEFSVLDPPRTRSLPPGTWTLQVSDPAEEAMPLQIDERSCQAGQAGTDQPVAVVRTSTGQLSVVVWSTREADRGAFNQARLQRVDYARARRTSLRNTVLFQSWAGKQYSDSPRAVYEEMVRQGRDEPALWVRRDSSVDLPDGTPSVLYGSREYYEALATARYVVANDAMPTFYDKRPGSFYLQTWHGTPLKRIGFDIENAQFGNVNYLSEFAVEVTKWDRLVSPNRFSSEIFRRAFDYRGEILETGYPRNDVFYAPDVDQRRAQVRRQLGLHPDQRVILWAPTWREDQRDGSGRYTLPLPFDLGTWDRILGPNDILLFRGHQLIQHSVGGMLRGLRQVRNVTLYPDIQDLYLAADLLITDYSSVMFDFANTRRPMIFYAWDLEHYRDHLRGFYLDFESTVPGPVITDLDSLREHLADPNPADHDEAYRRFVERFCSLEDGHASQRVVEALFSR